MKKPNQKIPDFVNGITLKKCTTLGKATANDAGDADVRDFDLEDGENWVADYDPKTDTAYTYCYPT